MIRTKNSTKIFTIVNHIICKGDTLFSEIREIYNFDKRPGIESYMGRGYKHDGDHLFVDSKSLKTVPLSLTELARPWWKDIKEKSQIKKVFDETQKEIEALSQLEKAIGSHWFYQFHYLWKMGERYDYLTNFSKEHQISFSILEKEDDAVLVKFIPEVMAHLHPGDDAIIFSNEGCNHYLVNKEPNLAIPVAKKIILDDLDEERGYNYIITYRIK